jgi:hypothetical protein
MFHLIQRPFNDLFRARIDNDGQMFELLNAAEGLMHVEEFKSIYVQWDITFRQRQELVARTSLLSGSSDATAGAYGGGYRFLKGMLRDVTVQTLLVLVLLELVVM